MSDSLTPDYEEWDESEASELTRRLWMQKVGETAFGLGFAGALGAYPAQTPSLPPGLYLPLTDHLGHALESAGRFHPIPGGSVTDYIKPRTGPFEPSFFSPSEFAVIERLTELILGEQSVDGNIASEGVVQEVAEWIDLQVFSSAGIREAASALDEPHRAVAVAYHGVGAIRELETFNAEKVCRDGLAWLEDESKSRHNMGFLDIEEREQLDALALIGDEPASQKAETPGRQFFKFLKSEVIRGFYTSRAGLKELDFKGNAFYAKSPGCRMD